MEGETNLLSKFIKVYIKNVIGKYIDLHNRYLLEVKSNLYNCWNNKKVFIKLNLKLCHCLAGVSYVELVSAENCAIEADYTPSALVLY